MTERSGQDIVGQPQAGALTGTEAVEVARAIGAPAFKTTTQDIANLGTSAGVPLTVTDGSTTVANTNYMYVVGGTVTNTGTAGQAVLTFTPGGAPSILIEGSGSAASISAMPTLANPPLAPVYVPVITNDGTTATNYQAPWGEIILPAASGTNNGTGIVLQSGAPGPGGSHPGIIALYTPSFSNPGTDAYAFGGVITQVSKVVNVTDPLGNGAGGAVLWTVEGVKNGTVVSGISGMMNSGGVTYGTTISNGSLLLFYSAYASGASITNIAGDMIFRGGNGIGGETASGANIVFTPGTASGASSLNTNGVVIHTATPNTDPSILGAEFTTSVAGVGYVFVRSLG